MDNRPIIWSCGGGRQSAAIAVLIEQGKLPVPERAVISDTSREKATTWRYLEQFIEPAMRRVGLSVEIVPHRYSRVDLYDKSDSLLIPAFTKGGEGQLRTFCSGEWKRDAIYRWLREPERGYGQAQPIIQWLGFSSNEKGRCKPSKFKWANIHWPLIMGYGHCLTAVECSQLVVAHGWDEPPESCCWMCPFQSNRQWKKQQVDEPDDHAKAVEFDQRITAADERDGLFVHFSGVPLSEANLEESLTAQQPLAFGRGCESGLCWT